MREIMDAVSDPHVHEMVIMKSAQVGFTEGILGNAIGYYIDQDPSPILIVQPSISDAEEWSKEKLVPMLRDTPCLHGAVSESKSRDSDNTMTSKSFPGGRLRITGAVSPKGLRRSAIRVALCDEVDGYDASAGSEGDPVELVVKRLTTYWNRKLVMGSTPKLKGMSRIERAFEKTDQRRYYVPCPHCGELQVLRWGGREKNYGLKWEEGKPDTAVYLCEHCAVLIDETCKEAMVQAGQWIPTKPEATVPGWHMNALISLFDGARWPYLVDEFLKTKDNPELLQVFVNTRLGESWEVRGEQIEPSALEARIERYGAEVPADVGVLTAGVDVHPDRLELEVKGWGDGEESWVIGHHRIYGDTEYEEVWQRLDAMLTRAYQHEAGATLRIRCCMIDSGYKTTEVYRFVRQRQARNVFASKGVDERGRAPLSRASRANRDGVKLYTVSTIAMKDTLFSRLRMTQPGSRYIHFCPPTDTGGDAEFFAQFGAEKLVLDTVKGKRVRRYVQVRKRNEAIDLEVLNLAALHALGAGVRNNLDRWVKVIQEKGDSTKEEKPDATQESTESVSPRPQARSFAARWRR